MQAARGTPVGGPAEAGSPAQPQQQQQPPPPSPTEQPEQRMQPAVQPKRRIGVLVGVALCVLALDIVTKVIVVKELSTRAPVSLLGGFLKLTESRNPGAAFSLGTSLTLLYSAIAITVIVVILRTSRRIRSLPWAVTLGLLLGGATGNLTDRIFRSPGLFRGWVVDWIELPHWPVFNLADSAIVCGGILAVLLSARGLRLDGARDGQ